MGLEALVGGDLCQIPLQTGGISEHRRYRLLPPADTLKVLLAWMFLCTLILPHYRIFPQHDSAVYISRIL